MDKEIKAILKENDKRWEFLRADYDPVTGKNAPGERTLLKIKDYAIPEQWVPTDMMQNAMVDEIAKAGSLKKFLQTHKFENGKPTEHDIEIELRKIRHRYDFTFWAYFCFPIFAKEGGEVRFKLNRPQIEVENEVERQRKAGQPIGVVIDKARQWGGSTYSIAKQFWILAELDPHHAFAVAAHVQAAAENILRMMKHAISKYPAWDLGLPEDEQLALLPAGKTGNAFAVKDSKGNVVIPGLIYIGSAQNPDSLRGAAVSGAHYSEVGVWPNTPEHRPEDLIASISGGILKRPLSMQIIESTAKATDDFFHETYISAKKGESSYTPLFIPWYFIPHDTIEITDKEAFIEELLEHKDDEERFGKWKDAGKHYWWLWELGATLEGINWYKYKRLDFTTYSQMANEAPSTDVESFQAAGQHVFDIYEVEAMRSKCRKPFKRGKLISDDRRDRGVLNNIKFIEHEYGNLDIWEFPDDSPVSNRYVVAVDIGGPNPTSDYHSVRVMDRLMMMPEYAGKPQVVAEMHYHCQRDDLVYDAVRLAKWYCDALLVIESNTLEMSDKERNVNGDGSQYVLDVAAELYWNLYAREAPADTIVEGAPKRFGFQTNARTKPMILDLLQWAIHEQAWDEPSEICIDELSIYIEDKPNHFTAPAKKHDDVLMATAILNWVAFKEMPLPKWINKEKTKIVHKENTIASF